jgi:hypothetical protein
MVACKATVFLLSVTSSDLVKTTNIECTHLMHAKLVLFTNARACGDLAAGCMGDGQGGPNLGKFLRGEKLNFPVASPACS